MSCAEEKEIRVAMTYLFGSHNTCISAAHSITLLINTARKHRSATACGLLAVVFKEGHSVPMDPARAENLVRVATNAYGLMDVVDRVRKGTASPLVMFVIGRMFKAKLIAVESLDGANLGQGNNDATAHTSDNHSTNANHNNDNNNNNGNNNNNDNNNNNGNNNNNDDESSDDSASENNSDESDDSDNASTNTEVRQHSAHRMQAYELFVAAADAPEGAVSYANFSVGRAKMQGEGTQRDLALARARFERCFFESGCGYSMNSLGRFKLYKIQTSCEAFVGGATTNNANDDDRTMADLQQKSERAKKMEQFNELICSQLVMRSADQGNAYAQCNLVKAQTYNQITQIDADWAHRAAIQGLVDALRIEGFLYQYGSQFVRKNQEKSVRAFRLCAQLDDSEGLFRYGLALMNGTTETGERDLIAARSLLERASAKGHVYATDYLETHFAA